MGGGDIESSGYPGSEHGTLPGDEVFVQIVTLIAVLLVTLGIVAASVQIRRRKEDAWRRFAAKRGLAVSGGGWSSRISMTGQIGDTPVAIRRITRSQGKSSATFTVYEATAPSHIPDDLRVTHETVGTAVLKLLGGQDIPISDRTLDGKLRVRGADEEATRALLDDPDVSAALYPFASAVRYSRIEGQVVTIERRGMEVDALGPHLGEAIALARALGAARLHPWRALAKQHDLSLRENGATISLEGHVDGYSLGIRAGPTGRGTDTVTAISVRLDQALARGLVIERRDDSSEGGLRLGDPVLDGAVHVSADDADDALRLLSARTGRDLRADLLAVVHGHPGSRVEADRIVLVSDGSTGTDADTLLGEALALARSLKEASAAKAESKTASKAASKTGDRRLPEGG